MMHYPWKKSVQEGVWERTRGGRVHGYLFYFSFQHRYLETWRESVLFQASGSQRFENKYIVYKRSQLHFIQVSSVQNIVFLKKCFFILKKNN